MQSAKILVVDDDAVARDLLADALKKEGYSVEAYGSGEEAIARGLGDLDYSALFEVVSPSERDSARS